MTTATLRAQGATLIVSAYLSLSCGGLSLSLHLSASLLSLCLPDPHQFRRAAQESYHSAPSLSLRHVNFPDATVGGGGEGLALSQGDQRTSPALAASPP